MKLILIRVELGALSFNRGDKILMPPPSTICMLMVGTVTEVMCRRQWWGPGLTSEKHKHEWVEWLLSMRICLLLFHSLAHTTGPLPARWALDYFSIGQRKFSLLSLFFLLVNGEKTFHFKKHFWNFILVKWKMTQIPRKHLRKTQRLGHWRCWNPADLASVCLLKELYLDEPKCSWIVYERFLR